MIGAAILSGPALTPLIQPQTCFPGPHSGECLLIASRGKGCRRAQKSGFGLGEVYHPYRETAGQPARAGRMGSLSEK
jgi:hypothetical protein